MKTIYFCLLAIIISCSSLHADTVRMLSTEQLLDRIKKGDMDAQAYLAYRYATGSFGVEQNRTLGIELLQSSANQGSPIGQRQLGCAYDDSCYTPHFLGDDILQARKWYQLSSDQGDDEAQYRLGEIYDFGRKNVIDVDKSLAVKYYILAAAQGNEFAKTRLDERGSSRVVTDWNYSDSKPLSIYTSEFLEDTYLQGLVSFSKGQKKRLYFSVGYAAKSSACDPKDYPNGFLPAVWEFNGQAISMHTFCDKFNDSENHYINATAASDKGSQFVINAFVKASNTVQVKNEKLDMPLSAKGFSKVWGKMSSEAL